MQHYPGIELADQQAKMDPSKKLPTGIVIRSQALGDAEPSHASMNPMAPAPSFQQLRVANEAALFKLTFEMSRIAAMEERASGIERVGDPPELTAVSVAATMADDLWRQNDAMTRLAHRLEMLANRLDRLH